MENSDSDSITPFFSNTSRVSLVSIPTPPRPRRLSCQHRRAAAVSKRPTWQIPGVEDATSARVVGVGLGREEAAAWEMFTAMERVLVVAVVATADKESERERRIEKLERSVEIRDEVLQNMQKKLEDLCEQMNYSNCHQSVRFAHLSSESDGFKDFEMSEKKPDDFCSYGHIIPQLSSKRDSPPLCGNLPNWAKDAMTDSGKIEMFKTGRVSMGEAEERRMSDLSDYSSVASSVDIQLSSLAEEQDLYNLRKECEEKDVLINELTTAAYESNVAASKRVSELEDIIKRKNMVITRLKKDLVVLEQKVIQLTRQRRSSSTTLNTNSTNIPALATNILYDMSSSSPSSSDSDSPVVHKQHQPQISVDSQSQPSTKSLAHSNSLVKQPHEHQSASPLKGTRAITRFDSTGALRPKRLVSTGSVEKSKRRTQQETCVVTQRRWS